MTSERGSDMTSESSASGRIRASDAEREEYATILREAVGEGRLSLAEGDERLAQIYAARYRDDLRPLIADLPHGAARGPQRSGPNEWHPGMPVPHSGAPSYRQGVVRHLGFLLTVSALLVGLWAITSSTFFWPAIPLTIFAIVAARRLFGFGWHRYYRRYYR
jgi:hypothetical protein